MSGGGAGGTRMVTWRVPGGGRFAAVWRNGCAASRCVWVSLTGHTAQRLRKYHIHTKYQLGDIWFLPVCLAYPDTAVCWFPSPVERDPAEEHTANHPCPIYLEAVPPCTRDQPQGAADDSAPLPRKKIPSPRPTPPPVSPGPIYGNEER